MENKKTYLIIQHYGQLSGSVIGLCNTVSMLSRNGGKVIVLVASCSDMVRELLIKSGASIIENIQGDIFQIRYFSGGPKLFSRTFIYPFFSIIRARNEVLRIYRKYHPDFIIANSIVISWIARLKKQMKGTIFLCHVRETLPKKNSFWSKVLLRLLNYMDGVMFISCYDEFNFNLNTKTAVIRDSVSVDYCIDNKRIRRTRQGGRTVISYLGGSNPIKGLDVLLNAIQLLPNRNAEFKIAGSINMTDMEKIKGINSILKGLNSNIEITVVGEVKDVSTVLESSDLLVCPSIEPHQLRPIFEAGFFGVPVVTTDYPEIKECIKNRYNGLTFREKDCAGLSKCMLELIDDTEYSIELGNNNYVCSKEKNSFEVVEQELLDFINSYI